MVGKEEKKREQVCMSMCSFVYPQCVCVCMCGI
jgi:hypothetical protein